MKKFFLILCSLFLTAGFAQGSLKTYTTKHSNSLSRYKEMGNIVTGKDSLNFKFYNNDTLVLVDKEFVKEYSYGICKGVNIKDFEALHQRMRKKLKQEPNTRFYVVHLE